MSPPLPAPPIPGLPAILLLALGLAADAVAVAAARGAAARRVTLRQVLLIALFFGGFQAGMPLVGYLFGSTVGEYLAAWDHWIAFGVLVFFGARMVYLAVRGDDDAEDDARDGLGLRILFILAIATSLDALAVGVTLPFAAFPLGLTIVTIGLVTAIASGLALVLGTRAGAAFGKRAEVVGGLVLVGLGVEILVSHLTA